MLNRSWEKARVSKLKKKKRMEKNVRGSYRDLSRRLSKNRKRWLKWSSQ